MMYPTAPSTRETVLAPRRIDDEPLSAGLIWAAAKRLTGEPLVHFFVLGAMLWGIHAHLQTRSQASRIMVSKALTAQLAEHYRQQYGASPTARQLDALIDSTIAEEMSYRQAIKLGLDQGDEIVRRRLIQKYEFLQQDLPTPRDPTQAEVQGFYDHHLERYVLPERLTFTHVYFSPDRRGDVGARDAAASLAAALSVRGVTRAPNEGDVYPGPADFVGVSAEEMARAFGRDGLSQKIGGVPIGHWSSPLRSGFGWHIVYVADRSPARQATLDEVRDRVTKDFLEAEHARRKAEAIAVIRGQFEVVRE